MVLCKDLFIICICVDEDLEIGMIPRVSGCRTWGPGAGFSVLVGRAEALGS